MSKELTEGALFEMEDCRVIEKMDGILDIKQYLTDKVNTHPTVNNANKLKALRSISTGLTKAKLMFFVSNMVLAHASKDLKVLR